MQSELVSADEFALYSGSSVFADLILLDALSFQTLAPLLDTDFDHQFDRSDQIENDNSIDQFSSIAFQYDSVPYPPSIVWKLDSKVFDVLAAIHGVYPRYFASIVVPKFVRKSYAREKRMLNATPVVLLDSQNFPPVTCRLSLVGSDGRSLPSSSICQPRKKGQLHVEADHGIPGFIKTAKDLQLATFEPFFVQGDIDHFHFRFTAFDENNQQILIVDSALSAAKSKIGSNLLRRNLLISGEMFAMQVTIGKSVLHVGTDFKLYNSWSPMCVVLLSDLVVQLQAHEIELFPNSLLSIPHSIIHAVTARCLKLKKTIQSGDAVVLVDLSTYSFLGPLEVFKLQSPTRRGVCSSVVDICFRDQICFRTPVEDYLSFRLDKENVNFSALGSIAFVSNPSPLQVIEMVEEKREFYSPLSSLNDLTIFPHVTRVSAIVGHTFTIYGYFPHHCRDFGVFVGKDPAAVIEFVRDEECICSLHFTPESNIIYLVSNSSPIVEKLSFALS